MFSWKMTQEEYNAIFDRCNDPNRGKLEGKFTFEDFIEFMKELVRWVRDTL